MTHLTDDSNSLPTTQQNNERLWVGVRVRPINVENEESLNIKQQRVLDVRNSQTLILKDTPLGSYSNNNGSSDIEHHFRTRSLFNSSGPKGPRTNTSFLNNNGSPKETQYDFDAVFTEKSSQEEVYQLTAAPLVRSVLLGSTATIFAYGPTSTGKTYSMIGTPSNPGIMARALDDIFNISTTTQNKIKTEVYLSYLEVYNEQIRDLLRPGSNLELREDKEQVHVAGLSEIKATTTHEVLALLHKGNKARTMEATGANLTSSRSHAVLLVTVRQKPLNNSGQNTEGKLYLIDLAGSERASNTQNSGVRLREGGHINRSLLALGNCITALASGDDKYINYRDSKLTRLLKAALGGHSKTAMLAHVSPLAQFREETRNTLLYAMRARAISHRVKKFIQISPSSDDVHSNFSLIQELRDEVKRLQTKLVEKESESDSYVNSPSPLLLSTSTNVGTSTNLPNYQQFRSNHDRPNLGPIKQEINGLFDEEFKLRNDLLKLDGAMLQSALDCEILRLMVLDWENLKVPQESSSEMTSGEESDREEINSVMIELREVRGEQEKLLTLRNEVEGELKRIRSRIVGVEEEASEYLPEVQREILSLLCKLQQDQLQKMSIEIEGELKRRGALLLRCLRQKALGEAIIHRQRHFLNVAMSGGYGGRDILSSNMRGLGVASPFFPPLPSSQQNSQKTQNSDSSHSTQAPREDNVFYSRVSPLEQEKLPPLNKHNKTTHNENIVNRPHFSMSTKYTDYRRRQDEEEVRKVRTTSSEDEVRELNRSSRSRGTKYMKKKRSTSQDKISNNLST